MTERISPETNKRPINKLVFIVFPDARTTGGPTRDRRTEIGLLVLEEKFLEASTKIIEKYKKQGFKVVSLLYSDSNEKNSSHLFPQNLFDGSVHLKKPFAKWQRDEYQDELPEIISNLGLSNDAQVIVGGFHATDCLSAAAGAFRNAGFNTKADIRLSDKLPFLLISHIERKMIYDPESQKYNLAIWETYKDDVENITKRRQLGSLV